MSIPIYYFTPARGDKNIGKAINDHVRSIQEDDAWICLRDCDTMFLTPNYAKHIEEIVEKYKETYDVIGCMTNRVGMKYQLINGQLSEDTDVRHHMNLAHKLEEEKYAQVVKSPTYIAGFFMVFSKKAWLEHSFEEGSILIKKKVGNKIEIGFFDYWFSNYFHKKRRVGLATGLYIFHLYRLFHKNRTVKDHLL